MVCVHDRKMKEPWCLVASESTVGTRTLIRYYGKRWGIETSFRDLKDMRFGMGLSARRVSSPQRRDRMLLLSALAIALLSLLGGAGESLGYAISAPEGAMRGCARSSRAASSRSFPVSAPASTSCHRYGLRTQ